MYDLPRQIYYKKFLINISTSCLITNGSRATSSLPTLRFLYRLPSKHHTYIHSTNTTINVFRYAHYINVYRYVCVLNIDNGPYVHIDVYITHIRFILDT